MIEKLKKLLLLRDVKRKKNTYLGFYFVRKTANLNTFSLNSFPLSIESIKSKYLLLPMRK